MAPIATSIDVDRPPGRVFAYVTDPSRFDEWPRQARREMPGNLATLEQCLEASPAQPI